MYLPGLSTDTHPAIQGNLVIAEIGEAGVYGDRSKLFGILKVNQKRHGVYLGTWYDKRVTLQPGTAHSFRRLCID